MQWGLRSFVIETDANFFLNMSLVLNQISRIIQDNRKKDWTETKLAMQVKF